MADDLDPHLVLRPVGVVVSPLRERTEAPRHGGEGAPDAEIHLEAWALPAAADLHGDDEIIVLTWLDRANRSTLAVHPRGDIDRPETGVFATRSPDRPNPIGLHHVRILDADSSRLRVAGLEAIDGTPVLDIKPVLRDPGER